MFLSKKKIAALSLVSVLAVTGCACNTDTSRNQSDKNGAAQYVQDTAITTRVKSDLMNASNIHSFISVTTTDRVVTLSGTVRRYQEKVTAVDIARKVPDVAAVKDAIVVKPK